MALYYAQQFATTKISVGGGIDASQTTGIVLQSTTGIDTAKPGILCLSWSDPLDTSAYEFITYTSIDGSNELQGVTRGTSGSTGRTHLNDADVAWVLSEEHINVLNDAVAIGGSATTHITGTLDEDDMASNSATKLATQQSIKAYVDASSGIPKKVRVYKDSAQSITNNTETLITFNQETFDNDTMHDNATNNSRITITTAGVYLIKAQLAFASNSTGYRQALFKKSNSSALAYVTIAAANGERTNVQITTLAELSASDYIEVYGRQTSGGNLNIEGAASDPYYATHFEAIRLGASS